MKHRYRIFETSTSLLVAYQALAIEYKRTKSNRETLLLIDEKTEANKSPTNHYDNYNYSLALLMLNASIIEGTFRSLLSERLFSDIEKSTQEGLQEGKTKPSHLENLVYKFRDDVETNGGWDKLKQHYSIYFNVVLDKSIDKDVKEAIDVLFTLRNVLSHGTAIIQPDTFMRDDLKDQYPYIWQRKLQQVKVYLKKVFHHEDIFENLSEYDVPLHFIEKTKLYFQSIEIATTSVPSRAKKTIEMLNSYEFGFRLW